jgi:type VI secretion system protein ImpL
LFTKKGYELFKEERKRVLSRIEKDESWVLGINENARAIGSDKAELSRAVTVLYASEYISHWQNYIDNVGVAKPKSLTEASQIVTRLSLDDSPLLRFLKGVVRETELVKEPESKESGSLVSSLENRVRQAVDSRAGVSGAADAASSLLPREDEAAMAVNRHFAPLRKFVNGNGGEGSSAPILQQMKTLNGVKDLLDRAVYAKETRQPMPDTGSLTSLSNIPPGVMPEPFRGVLRDVSDGSKTEIDTAKRSHDTNNLKDEVTEFCKKTIAGRYPFSSGAAASVQKNDFADMFAPGGRMDRFRQQQGPGARLPVEFEYARTIMDTFFRSGNQPEISFSIKPLLMDGSITNLNLNIGGQQIRYAHGPSVPVTVAWPGSGGGEVRMALLPPVDNGVNNVTETGLWALHRLFDKYGQIRPGTSPDVFEVVLNVGGRRSTFEIRPSSTNNPFNLPELRKFRCPQVMPSQGTPRG